MASSSLCLSLGLQASVHLLHILLMSMPLTSLATAGTNSVHMSITKSTCCNHFIAAFAVIFSKTFGDSSLRTWLAPPQSDLAVVSKIPSVHGDTPGILLKRTS